MKHSAGSLVIALLLGATNAHAKDWRDVPSATVGYVAQARTQKASLAKPLKVTLRTKRDACYLVGIAVEAQDAWSERALHRGLVYYDATGPTTLEQYANLALLELDCAKRDEKKTIVIEVARCTDSETTFRADCSGVLGKGNATITIFETRPPSKPATTRVSLDDLREKSERSSGPPLQGGGRPDRR